MTNYKLTLAYDGSRYDGWQKQGNTDRTIQGRLETLVSRLAGEPTEVHGAGRTDAGVHAKGQVCSFHLRKDWQSERLIVTVSAQAESKMYLNGIMYTGMEDRWIYRQCGRRQSILSVSMISRASARISV